MDLPSYIFGLGCGSLVTYVYMQWTKPPPGFTTYWVQTEKHVMKKLQFLGKLDEATSKRVAYHLLEGKKFTGTALERRHHSGGFLSHAQFLGIADDFVERKMATKNLNGTFSLHPSAFSVCKFIVGDAASKQAASAVLANRQGASDVNF